MKIFEYTGLPDTMPEHVIEKLFITVGMCGAVEENGKIYIKEPIFKITNEKTVNREEIILAPS